MSKNPNARIKGVLSEIGIHNELLDQQVACSRERKQSRAQEVVEA
jgi:hypothetical protein